MRYAQREVAGPDHDAGRGRKFDLVFRTFRLAKVGGIGNDRAGLRVGSVT